MENLRTRLITGARIGFYCGLALSAYVIVVLALGGGGQAHRANLGAIGVLLVYLIGGPVAGAVAVSLKPFAKNWLGYVLSATVVCIPVGLMVGMVAVPWDRWPRDLFLVTGILILAFGPATGTIAWYVFRDSGTFHDS